MTLKALGRLGVSRSASAVGACVGTNLNNDGIVLYEGMAALLVAHVAEHQTLARPRPVVPDAALVGEEREAGAPALRRIERVEPALRCIGHPLCDIRQASSGIQEVEF